MPAHMMLRILYKAGNFCIDSCTLWVENAITYFQSTIPFLFDRLRQATKASIDDPTLHTNTKTKLLKHFDEFFDICM